MNALRQHIWGVSPAQDRIWARVAGFPAERAVRRGMMIWQAAFDESESDGVFVLGGYLTTAEKWVKFTAEWEPLVNAFGTLGKTGQRRFKMKEMASSSERIQHVPAFYRVIEEYADLAISCVLRVSDLKRAAARIQVPGISIDWGFFKSPYLVTTRLLLDTFHGHRDQLTKIIPISEQVDFFFDQRAEKKLSTIFGTNIFQKNNTQIYMGILRSLILRRAFLRFKLLIFGRGGYGVGTLTTRSTQMSGYWNQFFHLGK